MTPGSFVAASIGADALTAAIGFLVIRKFRHKEDWMDTFNGGARGLTAEAAEAEFDALTNRGKLAQMGDLMEAIRKNPKLLTAIPMPTDEEGNSMPPVMLKKIYTFIRTKQGGEVC